MRKEHIVPIKVITEKLLKLGPKATKEDIVQTLDKYIHFDTITLLEDNRLNALGFNSKMPDGFWIKGHAYYDDPFARYKEAGIEITYNS